MLYDVVFLSLVMSKHTELSINGLMPQTRRKNAVYLFVLYTACSSVTRTLIREGVRSYSHVLSCEFLFKSNLN